MSTVSQQPVDPLALLGALRRGYPDKGRGAGPRSPRTSYRDFALEATCLARALQASGIAPGDRVVHT